MKLPNRKLSLEEVLGEFFYSTDNPSPDLVLRACEEHPEYRADIVEFAAFLALYKATPEPCEGTSLAEVADEDVSLLQSIVLNRLHTLDKKSTSEFDESALRACFAELAGAKLRKATAAAGLGVSSSLLTKVLTNRIFDAPKKVLNDLAHHLNVTVRDLQRFREMALAGSMSYKASVKPNAPQVETWEHAVRALPVSDEEKMRLLALQREEDSP